MKKHWQNNCTIYLGKRTGDIMLMLKKLFIIGLVGAPLAFSQIGNTVQGNQAPGAIEPSNQTELNGPFQGQPSPTGPIPQRRQRRQQRQQYQRPQVQQPVQQPQVQTPGVQQQQDLGLPQTTPPSAGTQFGSDPGAQYGGQGNNTGTGAGAGTGTGANSGAQAGGAIGTDSF